MKIKAYFREFAKTILLFSACILIFSVIKLIPAFAARGYTGQTIGIASLVSTVEDSGGHAGGTKHRVYVNYTVDEKEYAVLIIHGRFDDPRVGDAYHIRYNTENPEKCYVDSYPNSSLEDAKKRVLVLMTLIILSALGVKVLKTEN